MKSWQTTLGGALTALGKSLMAVGILPQLAGVPNSTLTWIALSGFIVDAVGGFFTALFAADSKALQTLTTRVNENTSAIETTANAVSSGDTTHLKRSREQ